MAYLIYTAGYSTFKAPNRSPIFSPIVNPHNKGRIGQKFSSLINSS